MTARIRSHIRSNLVASIALLLALSGGTTAYAIDGSLPGQNTVGSEDIMNGEVKAADVANNAVGSTRILDGAVFAPDLATDSVNDAKVANDTLTGADVNEGTLDGAAIPGISRDGRIHVLGGNAGCIFDFCPAPERVVGDLALLVFCGSTGVTLRFYTKAGGTANAMIVASGVDPYPSTGYDFNVRNFASAQGTVLHRPVTDPRDYPYTHYASYRMNDGAGFANAESQFVIDVGDKTYSVALHTYHEAYEGSTGPPCETFGNATIAG